MKKNMYSVSGAQSIVSKSHSNFIGIPRKITSVQAVESEVNSYLSFIPDPIHISEELSRFQVQLEKEDLERYQNSFLKKKMLNIWKGQRSLVKAVPQLPKLLEPTIYQTVYQEMKPLLPAAYEEDFKLPLVPFTFFGWLQYTRLASQLVGKHWEAGYWEEMEQFFRDCMNYELLNDLLEEQNNLY